MRTALAVDGAVGVVVLGAIWAVAELTLEEDEVDRVTRERPRGLLELRRPLGRGARADVHPHHDLLRLQRRKEVIRCMRECLMLQIVVEIPGCRGP